jgi:hypothetical protein
VVVLRRELRMRFPTLFTQVGGTKPFWGTGHHHHHAQPIEAHADAPRSLASTLEQLESICTFGPKEFIHADHEITRLLYAAARKANRGV